MHCWKPGGNARSCRLGILILRSRAGGEVSDVAWVYNRYKYLPERKAALEAWGRFIENLIRPDDNIVALAAE
jgi:hypothetical protein